MQVYQGCVGKATVWNLHSDGHTPKAREPAPKGQLGHSSPTTGNPHVSSEDSLSVTLHKNKSVHCGAKEIQLNE